MALLGIASLAFTEPMLGLLGRSPEYFIASGYRRRQIVLLALAIAVVPSLLAISLMGAAARIGPRIGTLVFRAAIALFAGFFVLTVMRRVDIGEFLIVGVLTILGGALAWILVARARAFRLLLSYIALSSLAFLGVFFLGSRTSALLTGGGSATYGPARIPALKAPLVVIILDEFPVGSIMTGEGEIDEVRFPGFAELGSTSTWYRNASSRSSLTARSVPSILDGRIGSENRLPTAVDHPASLFTLVGRAVPVTRYESVTDMCPVSICERPPAPSIGQIADESWLLFRHQIYPPAWRDNLAPIDEAWAGFHDSARRAEHAATDDAEEDSQGQARNVLDEAYERWESLDEAERGPVGQSAILRTMGTSITSEPSLHVIHVALPHRPWQLDRSGATLARGPDWPDPELDGYEFDVRLMRQLHEMQVGAADSAIAEVVTHLQALPNWEDITLVVTSDHGINLTPPAIGRTVESIEAHPDEVFRIPLFIKAPGQTMGALDDRPAQTIDVLPTLIDHLSIDVSWELDGRSLVSDDEPSFRPLVSSRLDPLLEQVRRRDEHFPHGDGWVGLAAVGPLGHLVGVSVAEQLVGRPSDNVVTIEQLEAFGTVSRRSGETPFVVFGWLHERPGPPPREELLVALNGRIAGVLGGYRGFEQGWAFRGFLADFFRDGANDVAVYEVVDRFGRDVLRPVEIHKP